MKQAIRQVSTLISLTTAICLTLVACGGDGTGYTPGNATTNTNVSGNSTDGTSTDGGTNNTVNSNATNANTTYTGTNISGVVRPLALNGNNVSFANITLEVIDVTTGSSLQDIALDATNSACATTGCPFQFKNVDLSAQAFGLVIVAKDSRTGAAATWVDTGTATATPDQVAAAISNKTDLNNQYVFPLNIAARTIMGTSSIGKAQNANLNTAGSILGLVIGSSAEATAANNYTPPPVANAKVTGPSNATIYYPNAQLSGKGNATASGVGAFIAVPNDTTQVFGTFTVQAGAGDTHSWPAYSLGINAGYIMVALFEAN